MKQWKIDLVVALSVLAVICVGGYLSERLKPPTAPGTVIANHEVEIQEGMSLGQVWSMWGPPDTVGFDDEYHLADYIWLNPFRHVLFSTDSHPWVVISYWGCTKGQATP